MSWCCLIVEGQTINSDVRSWHYADLLVQKVYYEREADLLTFWHYDCRLHPSLTSVQRCSIRLERLRLSGNFYTMFNTSQNNKMINVLLGYEQWRPQSGAFESQNLTEKCASMTWLISLSGEQCVRKTIVKLHARFTNFVSLR